MRYSTLLFDADDTLFDFAKAQANALEKAMQALGVDFQKTHLDVYDTVNKALWQAFEQGKLSQKELKERRFREFLEVLGLDLNPEKLSELYLQHLAQGYFLLHGALELIQTLQGKCQMLIVTNGLKEVQRPRFNASPLKAYFAGIIVSGELGVAKPDTAIFDAAFAALNTPKKSKTLMIGDSLSSDMQGGINYGIDTCWFNLSSKPNTANLPITHEVNNLAQILDLV